MGVSLYDLVEEDVGEVHCVAGELDFEVAIKRGRNEGRFGKTKSGR